MVPENSFGGFLFHTLPIICASRMVTIAGSLRCVAVLSHQTRCPGPMEQVRPELDDMGRRMFAPSGRADLAPHRAGADLETDE
jgi:hypothetical protein